MPIPAPELATLVESAVVGAAPSEESVGRHVAAQVRNAGIGATLDSASSRSLRSAIDASHEELGQEAVACLAQVELYGHESGYINAIPNVRRGCKRVIVFDGLKHLVHYYADLLKVLDHLQRRRPDAEYELADGSRLPEALAFSMAGFSILSDFQESQRVPVVIHDMLGSQARAEVLAAFRGALCFVLLHEVAHIELGHLSISGTYSERQHFSLVEPEELDACKEHELAADAFAMSLIPPVSRAAFAPSLVFLLGAFAFIEVFSGNLSREHPLAINRLSALIELCAMAPQDKQILVGWIEQHAENFRKFERDRADHGGSIRGQIAASVSVRDAYRILLDIKSKVLDEEGLLGDAQSP